jgi:hypothetical protein
MAITKTARNMIQLGAGGSYSTARDAIRHQVWDTRYFASSPSDQTYFTQPIGAPWRVGSKTKNETNMLDSGKLPNGQTLLLTRIGVALISAYDTGDLSAASWANASILAQAYVNIMQSSVFEIRIAGREFDFQIHGRQFLPALCINGYNAGTAGSVARIGDTIVNGWVKLEPSPIFLDELVSFNVTQLVNNGDTTNIMASGKPLNNAFLWLNNNYSTMQVVLEGFLTRAK